MSSPRASPRAASPSKDRKMNGSQSPKAAAPAATAPWMAWAKSHASTITYLAFFGLNSIVLMFAPHLFYPTSAKDVTLWFEVASVVHLLCFLKQCPGSMGYFMTACVHLAFMAKHKFVNGVNHPIYMIVFGIVFFGLATYSHFFNKATKFGLYSFMFVNAAQFVMFFFLPLDMAVIYGNAVKLCGVIAAVSLANVLSSCPGTMGRVMAMTVYLLYLCYDYFVTKTVAPVPVIALAAVAFAANLYAFAQERKGANTVSSPKVKST